MLVVIHNQCEFGCVYGLELIKVQQIQLLCVFETEFEFANIGCINIGKL